MTKAQKEDLMVEWSLCNNALQREIMQEYVDLAAGHYVENSLLEFLRERLNIDSYWKTVGLI